MNRDLRRCETIEVVVTERWLRPEGNDPGRILVEYWGKDGERRLEETQSELELTKANLGNKLRSAEIRFTDRNP